MAMDVGGAKGGVKSDINVTPLVDVMLVLLIIVMLIAPLLQQGVLLTLPPATTGVAKPDTLDQTTVYVDGNGRLYINAIELSEAELIPRLSSILESKTDKTVYLKGDRDATYGAIMKMMDAIHGAKIETVALITETTTPAQAAAGGH
jgi:biopolymer transport protein TolR